MIITILLTAFFLSLGVMIFICCVGALWGSDPDEGIVATLYRISVVVTLALLIALIVVVIVMELIFG